MDKITELQAALDAQKILVAQVSTELSARESQIANMNAAEKPAVDLDAVLAPILAQVVDHNAQLQALLPPAAPEVVQAVQAQ